MSWRDDASRAMQARAGDLACVVLALLIGGLAVDATDVETSQYADVNDLVGLAAAAALWWRRRAPLVVASATFIAAAVAPLAAGAAIVSVYAVAAHHRGQVPIALGALYVASAVVGTILFPDEHLGVLGSLLVGVLFTVAAVGWGLATRSRQALMDTLAERAERAEREQQARVAEAQRAERTRIATEMHDILAHRLSMLSLHAGALELRPEAPPDDLAHAAAVVRSNAHLALDELRMVIGVLREDAADLEPPPTMTDIDALVEECRTAGMRIELADSPNPAASVPTDLGRHVYRIVQEGLTNARKHAPRQPVQLSVTGRAGERICVDITNPTGTSADDIAVPGAGIGLIGLRERVELVGGMLESGPDDTGTYRLRALLPWPTRPT